MSGRLALLVAAMLAWAFFVSGAGATFSPAEQAWNAPLVRVWNLQNSSLKFVVNRAVKPNALVAGNKPDILKLTNTLVALADRKQPKERVKLAGAPFGAVTKRRTAQVTPFLKQGTTEFTTATLQLGKAYNALQTLGGGAAAGLEV